MAQLNSKQSLYHRCFHQVKFLLISPVATSGEKFTAEYLLHGENYA